MAFLSLSDSDLKFAQQNLHLLSAKEREQVLQLLEEREQAAKTTEAREHFLPYVKHVWPDFIEGAHHVIMAEAFEKVARGEIKRLAISIGPRHGKSELASVMLPSWFLGKFPNKKIIQVSNSERLASRFGRKVRNLIGSSAAFKEVFPNVALSQDSQAAAEWHTNYEGEYLAAGVGGNLAGFGADIGIVDDPHSDTQAKQAEANPAVFDDVVEWYSSSIRQRLQPNGAIIIVMCVAEGERVLMHDGRWRPIEQIVVGDKVIGYLDGKPVPRTVTATMPQGPDDLVEVVSRSCSLKVNRRHPFLVMRGGLTTSPKTQEDVIQSRDWYLEWVPAGDLKPKDVVVTIKALQNGNGHRPMPFPGSRPKQYQMNQKDYWLFGFMFGDGWLASTKARGHTGVCIATSDKPHLDARVLATAKECWGVDFYPTKFGYVRCDNKALARWLADKGFGSGAKTKRVPEWVFRLRNADKRAFLDGFFHADGWLRPSEQVETWQVGLANRELLDDLRLLARTCGVKTTKIYHYEWEAHAPNSPAPTEARNYCARFSMRAEKIELRGRYKNMGQDGLGRYFRLEEVDEIRPVGRGNVYDITVEGAESFVAEGFVVHNTRWSKRDLVGQVLRRAQDDKAAGLPKGTYDDWTVINLPAILDEDTPTERPLWPGFWTLEELQATKKAIGPVKWAAQYAQQPTGGSSAIFKNENWRIWGGAKETCPHPDYQLAWNDGLPPPCKFVLHSWDTALRKNERADYSAFTSWGIFETQVLDVAPESEDPDAPRAYYPRKYKTIDNIILLSAYKARLDFPELKRKVREFYDEDTPDSLLIEDKGSGTSLIQEMRSMGIAVDNFSYGRGRAKGTGQSNDKIARANMVTDIFASGYVWIPERRFAEMVRTEMNDFPAGEHDDLVDSTVQAMIRFREGGFVRTANDEQEDETTTRIRRKRYY